MSFQVHIVGAGLAGCESALFLADRGVEVSLYDMKPGSFSPAHKSSHFSELVCSNSLRSDDLSSAVGLLKHEMTLLGSNFMSCARATSVGAGKALAVDRDQFSSMITNMVVQHPNIEIIQKEVTSLPVQGVVILATGPLTTSSLVDNLSSIFSTDYLHFYDAISPIVSLESIDFSKCFWADRYSDGEGDYLNCPLSEQEYESFLSALLSSDQVPLHDFEDPLFFEGCLPIEVMAERGSQTLLFGPFKPVGLIDPSTGRRPYAVAQLRKENLSGDSLNLVGCQTKLTYAAQDSVFRMIPALKNADFLRFGSIHRNTFIDAPNVLDCFLRVKTMPNLFLAGQFSGVEGYVESAAMGLLVGINVYRLSQSRCLVTPPPLTAIGSLVSHLITKTKHDFQPSNVNFGLFPPLLRKFPKKQRKFEHTTRSLSSLSQWCDLLDIHH